MLALYPSNKLEHLSFLLGALIKQQPGPPLQAETILVESPGMQHWLNMELAREQGIAMNLTFPLPTRFMWNTARLVLGEDKVPRQSVYRREVLVWRIEKLIQEPEFCALPEAQPVCRYWQHIEDTDEQAVQRLQFATALADVFEQYQLYRPEWLFAWETNTTVQTDSEDELWQAAIWQRLVKEAPLHPARLHQQAVSTLHDQGCDTLPARIIVFAINTMAPQLVQFFDALAQHTDIHLFHLNPSVSYWGETKSDRERARLLREQGIAQWQEASQDNPLLGNLGKQGRDLFNLLTDLDTFEVSAFDVEAPDDSDSASTLLNQLQQDILHARPADAGSEPRAADDSITLIKAHSPLREVQALHDYLLYQMQQNPDLAPGDIVVMCPAIEDYAPLIDAVFHRVGTSAPAQSTPPRIVCSIADRSPLDAEPLIAAFLSLLSLPDSRFEVSKIMDYLRLDAMRKKFGLAAEDLDLMQYWLEQAHVHWGLDGEHKRQVTRQVDDSYAFSWYWGLERLLTGMALGDSALVYNDMLSVPHVEGQNSVILGKLISLVSQLKHYAGELNQPRTAQDWHQFLMTMRTDCFEPENDQLDVWESISKATADLAAHCDEAGYDAQLTLRQIKEVLVKRFSSPDAGNHFLTGQVTFCSMLPMRSIPFKIVCILGLNDGEFPRQSQPISIDLMANSSRKIGDRSRRLEDRYLFLEALISARTHLYLSYQANSAQDNSERQPSLVLAEFQQVLMDYRPQAAEAQQLPLHPFSVAGFQRQQPGFEKGWLRLAQAIAVHHDQPVGTFTPLPEPRLPDTISPAEMARGLCQPFKYFANQQLGLYLEAAQPVLNDAEPFSANNLTRFQTLSALNEARHEQRDPAQILHQTRLSGDLPTTPLATELLEQWDRASESMMAQIHSQTLIEKNYTWYCGQSQLTTTVWQQDPQQNQQPVQDTHFLVTWHSGAQNTSRLLQQYISMLMANAQGQPVGLLSFYCKWKKGEPELHKATFKPCSAETADSLLTGLADAYILLHQQPVAWLADVALVLLRKSKEEPLDEWALRSDAQFEWQKIWEGNSMSPGLKEDPYLQWFFPHGLALADLPLQQYEALFRPLLNLYSEKKL